MGATREELIALLIAYEGWEADLIMSGDWSADDGMPKLTEELYDSLIELQKRRNRLLKRTRGEQ